MTRVFAVLALFAIATAFAPSVSAHDDYRVVGTVTKQKEGSIEVTIKDGTVVFVALTNDTVFKRDDADVAADELKVGTNVVVDGSGDSRNDLEAYEVRIVPTITPTN